MNKIVALLVIVVVLLLLLFFGIPFLNQGTVTVEAQDPPTDPIYLTVSSVMLHSINGSWMTVSNRTVTFQLNGNVTQIAQGQVPSGHYNIIRLYVTSATLQVGGVNITAKVPSNKLDINIVPGGANVTALSHITILISFPHVTSADGEVIISPSTKATVVS